MVVLRDGAGGPEVLMVRRHRGSSFMADAYVFPGGRVETSDGEGEAAFPVAAARELAEEAAITIDPSQLVPFARWITPSAEGKRFDARFYVAAAPADQVAHHDSVETVDSLWATPADVLARYEARRAQAAAADHPQLGRSCAARYRGRCNRVGARARGRGDPAEAGAARRHDRHRPAVGPRVRAAAR